MVRTILGFISVNFESVADVDPKPEYVRARVKNVHDNGRYLYNRNKGGVFQVGNLQVQDYYT